MPPLACRYAVLLAACSLSVLLPSAIAASADRYVEADTAAGRGDAAAAEAAYDKLLQKDPNDARALNGRATARAWAGKHDAAQADYSKVLARDPQNLEALTGLGYSYAWNKQYGEAERTFKAALALAPENAGAVKGLGYTYLWSGRNREALAQFQSAAARWPRDAEIQVAIAKAQAGLGERSAARASYQAALSIDPTRNDAREGLRSLQDGGRRHWGEVQVWAGTTSNGDTGLRSVEVAYMPADDWRLWVRYDNTLSLDNPALARAGVEAETYFAGALHRFDENWYGLVEVGYRDLPGGADQEIFRVEGTHVNGGHVKKLGLQVSPHSDGYTDTLVYASYGFDVAKGWRLEPAVYYSDSGASDDKEWRGVLHLEYKDEDGWSAAVGVGGGTIESNIPGNDGGVFVADARVSVPIADDYEVHVAVRHEEAPQNDYTIVMVGLTMCFGGE